VTAHSTYTGALYTLVSPQNSATVYLTTDSDGVFKTTDCGSTWTKVNTGTNGKQIDMGRIWNAVIDPVATTDTIYLLTGYGPAGVWKSTNGGVDWAQLFATGSEILTVAGGFTERIAMDPTNHLHLLVNFHSNCSGKYTGVCLGETTDGGATWSIVQVPASVSGSSGEGSGIIVLAPDVWIYGSGFGGLWETTDHGKTWTNQSPPKVGGVSFGGPIFQAMDATDGGAGTYYLPTLQGVVSSPDGMKWSLVPNSGASLAAVIGDGVSLFGGTEFPNSTTYYYSAPYTNLSQQWASGMIPGLKGGQGINDFAYDPAHNLLYAAVQDQGFWRMVTH
jgi:photosystem II stability/assembly factor-like uncharacterized protein